MYTGLNEIYEKLVDIQRLLQKILAELAKH